MKEVTQVTLYFNSETHKKLKMAAVLNDTTVTAIVNALVEKFLEVKHE